MACVAISWSIRQMVEEAAEVGALERLDLFEMRTVWAKHSVNLNAAIAYVLKGANQKAASEFGLSALKPGGRIIGKRCGTSQNIGAKARKERN